MSQPKCYHFSFSSENYRTRPPFSFAGPVLPVNPCWRPNFPVNTGFAASAIRVRPNSYLFVNQVSFQQLVLYFIRCLRSVFKLIRLHTLKVCFSRDVLTLAKTLANSTYLGSLGVFTLFCNTQGVKKYFIWQQRFKLCSCKPKRVKVSFEKDS